MLYQPVSLVSRQICHTRHRGMGPTAWLTQSGACSPIFLRRPPRLRRLLVLLDASRVCSMFCRPVTLPELATTGCWGPVVHFGRRQSEEQTRVTSLRCSVATSWIFCQGTSDTAQIQKTTNKMLSIQRGFQVVAERVEFNLIHPFIYPIHR